MDNPRLFTGSIRNHPAGIAPDSLIRLSPSPYRKLRAEFYVKTPLGSNSKFQYSFHGLRVLRPTLDTGSPSFALRPPSPSFAPFPSFPPSPQPFFSAPRRDPLSSGPHFRSLPVLIHPSSCPAVFTPLVANSPSQSICHGAQPQTSIPIGRCADIRPPPCAYSAATPSGVHR